MTRAVCESGMLLGEYPFVRVGRGPQPLLVIPGAEVDNSEPSWLVRHSWQAGFARFAHDHTVYIVHRRRKLPTTVTIDDLAAEYVRVLHAIGPAHVMGLSTGGLIAQRLAAQAPELIERLVLVVTGDRLSTAGCRIVEQWQTLARTGQWAALNGAMSEILVTGAISKRLIRGAMRAFGAALVRPPQYPDDFIVTMNAALRHDTTALLPTLRVPSLLIGGSLDPFFPTPLLRETAALIPGAVLNVYEGAGHGLMKWHKRRFENDVLGFLTPASAAA